MAARTVLAAAAAGLLLYGCASEEQTAVDWAEGICVAVEEVEASLQALGSSLEIDQESDADAIEQVQEQVEEQTDALVSNVEDLGTAVRDVPMEADPEVTTAADELEQEGAALDDSVVDLQDAASTLTDAENVPDAAAAVADTATQLSATVDQAEAFASSVQSLASEGQGSVQEAFAEAPTCAAGTAE